MGNLLHEIMLAIVTANTESLTTIDCPMEENTPNTAKKKAQKAHYQF